MYRPKRSFLHPLLLILMLVAGPLHAQILYACTKIEKTAEMIVHDISDQSKNYTNLCNDHQDCINLDFDNVIDSNQNPCCEQSVVLSIDQSLQQSIPIINSVFESNIDPPQAMDTAFDFVFQQQVVLAFVVFPRINLSGQSGSNTYLITQRLRI